MAGSAETGIVDRSLHEVGVQNGHQTGEPSRDQAGDQNEGRAAEPVANERSIYAEIIHRSIEEDGFAESLVNLTPAGREYLERSALEEPDRTELLSFIRVALIGTLAEQAAQQPSGAPPPSDPPDNPEVRELKEQVTKIELEQRIAQALESKRAAQDTWTVVSSMKEGLKTTVQQIDDAFRYTMWMYIGSFVMGIALIAAGIVSAFTSHGKDTETLSIALGGLGTATTLAFFFTKPPERLQSSRANLAQLQSALLVWFNDFLNQNALLQILSPGMLDPAQRDQVLSKVQEISRDILTHTNQILEMLQKNCKLVEGSSDRSDAADVLERIKKLVP